MVMKNNMCKEQDDERVDDITNMVMDEIRDVLQKYEQYYPEWIDDDLDWNLDDRIYSCLHTEIREAYENEKNEDPFPDGRPSIDEHLSNAYCDAIKTERNKQNG